MPPEGAGEEFEHAACLLHEFVVRGRSGNLICDALEREMREHGHPLAWLPPWLLPVESELHHFLPRFSSNGLAVALPGNASRPLESDPVPPDEAPTVVDSEPLAARDRLFVAVRGWAEESNGLLEGKVYQLDRPLADGAIGDWFAELPADSLAGALTAPRWSLNRRTSAEALAHLFAAAHSGGAYGRREWGAYGRLHAWQSFGALAGCDPAADAVAIASEAGRCEWLSFSGTDWFYDLIDLGLFCVRPDRLTVTLLAATDTD